MCRGRRARILLHLHIQLRGGERGRRAFKPNHQPIGGSEMCVCATRDDEPRHGGEGDCVIV